MKIWYASLRPYWEKSSLYMGVCDGGFGNPSGHTFISFFGYLMFLSYVLRNKYIKDKIIIKIILIIIFVIWIFWFLLVELFLEYILLIKLFMELYWEYGYF